MLAVACAAQAAGWLMAALAPVLVRVLLDAHAGGEMARLRRERAALEADWASGQEAMLGREVRRRGSCQPRQFVTSC